MAEKNQVKKVAPDGGWGWFIIVGFSISMMIAIPILQSFGLLFRDVFQEMNLSATDISTIINVNSGFGLMLGIMNGPLLKIFGYRKMAMFGSLMMFVGFILTSWAKTFLEFIIFYGIINSIGFSMTMASFGLATYTYFREKRAMAAGIGATLTGLGPVVMPLFISTFMEIYGARGTCLILSGLLLHSFAASLLLQPIKWHYKIIREDSTEKEIHSDKIEVKKEIDVEGIEEYDSSGHRLDGVIGPKSSGRRSALFNGSGKIAPASNVASYEKPRAKSVEPKQSWYTKLVKFFDLDLLKDPIYRNIWIGMSLAYTGEMNFSLMMPIILGDRKFSIEQTAKIMSVIATTDIIFRFLAPFIGDKTKLPARQLFMISLIMLIMTRFAFTFVYSYNDVIVVGAFLGIAKGFRTVYMYLVVPNYVPLEKLASASGLETVLNGILLLSLGPLVGFTRDYFGNYNVVVHLINIMTFLTISLWSIEMLTMPKNQKITTINNNIPK